MGPKGVGDAALRVGVDVGGTFTDIVVVDGTGMQRATKVPTQERVFLALRDGLNDLDVSLADVELIIHGTTVATNALVQRRGARTVLITTEGFRDVLEIRRTNKGDLFDLNWSPPAPLIARRDRLEVSERMSWTGEPLQPLDRGAVDRLAHEITIRDAEAVAIVFLHAYANPSHEQELRALLAERCPDVHYSVSSEVAPSYREFERTTTTAANAFIAPVVERYVDRFARDLAADGFKHRPLIMQSNGGVTSVETCVEIPAKTIQSGPAGGTVALAAEATRSGYPNMIGLDIGGTTADVSMVWDFQPKWRPDLTVEFGLPILFPTMDIMSIGAGGGTIAWIDRGGALRVGPRSAGANPGPACYGNGGVDPTGTDAQVVLGRMASGSLLGGRMALHPALAEKAVMGIADQCGISIQEAAAGIVEILTNNMIQAVRLVTIERGFDPHDFALCAFGGAGSLYAADIARDLNLQMVVVPRMPGVLSASGLLQADMVHDKSRSVLAAVAALTSTEVDEQYAQLENGVLALFDREGLSADEVLLERHADLLYAGQTHTLSVPVAAGPFDSRSRDEMLAGFHREHLRRFGHSDPSQAVEFVTLRAFGRHHRERPPEQLGASAGPTNSSRLVGPMATRNVYFAQAVGFIETPIYKRSQLPPGTRLPGPAVIEQMDATTVIPPDMTAEIVADSMNIAIQVGG